MNAPPNVTVTYDPVWRKRRSFWIWNVTVSAILMVICPVIGALSTVIGMKDTFGRLGDNGADVAALANHIDRAYLSTAIGMGLSVLAFIWMVVAIIRLCTLPKPDLLIPGAEP